MIKRLALGKMFEEAIKNHGKDIRHDCEGKDLSVGDIVKNNKGKAFRCVEFNTYHGLGLRSIHSRKMDIIFYSRCFIEMYELRKVTNSKGGGESDKKTF